MTNYLFKHEDRTYDLTIALKNEFGEFAKIRDNLLEQLRYCERWADEELDDIYEAEEKEENYWFDFTENDLDEIQHECRMAMHELSNNNTIIDYNFSSILGINDDLTDAVEKYNEMLYKAIRYIELELEQRSYADSIFGELNAI